MEKKRYSKIFIITILFIAVFVILIVLLISRRNIPAEDEVFIGSGITISQITNPVYREIALSIKEPSSERWNCISDCPSNEEGIITDLECYSYCEDILTNIIINLSKESPADWNGFIFNYDKPLVGESSVAPMNICIIKDGSMCIEYNFGIRGRIDGVISVNKTCIIQNCI